MPRPSLRPRAQGVGSRRATRLVALAAVLQLGAGLGALVLVDGPAASPAAVVRSARVGPPALTSREAAVRDLLAARSAALLARDERGFLSGLDPDETGLRSRQRSLFAALEQVPLATWRYVLQPDPVQPSDAAQQHGSAQPSDAAPPSAAELDRRYGAGRWWAPPVVLEHALAGFDDRPLRDAQRLVFVLRDGRWLLADDGGAPGRRSGPPDLWDLGPVVAERADGVLVLGRPADRPLLRDIAVLTSGALPDVSTAWGTAWSRRAVVVVPGDRQELRALLDSDVDLADIAAVATADLVGGPGAFDPVGDRIVVNAEAFGRLTEAGRRLVLTHEVTHVATRRATGPAVPAWLAEGFADHVAHAAADLPLALSAGALSSDVRAGRLPQALPTDADLAGSAPDLATAYEQAWWAVRLLAEQHGEEALLRLYRRVGSRRGVAPGVAVEQALRSELGTTTERLTADWRASLQRDLG